MRRVGIHSLVIGAGLLTCGLAAQAQGGFVYTTIFTPNPILETFADGNMQINAINRGDGTTEHIATTNIVLTNFTTSSTIPDSSTDSFSQPFSVAVTLQATDSMHNPTGSPITNTFTGTLSGIVTQSASAVNHTYNNPVQMYDFGSLGVYTVTLGSLNIPTPQDTSQGAFNATVTFQAATPEPGSIATLLGLGASGTLLAWRRRRRRRLG